MCEPISIASMAMTAIATGMSMIGQQQQGKAAQAQANAQAQAAADQQVMGQQQAQAEIAKGAAEDARHRRQAAQQHSEMISSLAAGGFELDSGSSLLLASDNAEEIQHDSNIIKNNANLAAWGHQVGANTAGNQASMFKAQGQNSGATALNMGATALGGLGTMGAQYNMYKQTQSSQSGGSYGLSTYSGPLASNSSKLNSINNKLNSGKY